VHPIVPTKHFSLLVQKKVRRLSVAIVTECWQNLFELTDKFTKLTSPRGGTMSQLTQRMIENDWVSSCLDISLIL
jgi:hypothetical protein